MASPNEYTVSSLKTFKLHGDYLREIRLIIITKTYNNITLQDIKVTLEYDDA